MWYRLGQKGQQQQQEDPESQLKTKNVTQKEIDLAKAILNLQNDALNSEIKKVIGNSKQAFMNYKKAGEVLNSLADLIPLDFIKPTLKQWATDLNSQAESYLGATLYTEIYSNEKEKKAFESFAKNIGDLPTDQESAIKFVKKLNSKDYAYVINLVGDFLPLGPWGKAALTPVKIADYRATWFPKFEQDVAKYKAAQNKFDTAKDQKTKDQAWDEITQSISGILGVISNALIDIAVFVEAAAVILALVAPWIAAAGAAVFAVGLGMQAFSTTLDKYSPFYYKKLGSLPSTIATGIMRMSEGLPFSESTTKERIFSKPTGDSRVLDEILKASLESSIFNYLNSNFENYNKKDWFNKYNNPKTINLIDQPLNIVLSFAKDIFGNKYPWLAQPNTVEYQNFARYITRTKSMLTSGEKKQPPSKRSIAVGMIETALNSGMTYKFTKPLIRQMANKYTAGNIYNFLNKKNVEIIDLLGREMQNQNFAARYNVRPGNAGYDAVRIDIGNLKKILNTWK